MVNVANLTRTAPPTDVYTDLNGLNRIKQEKSDDKALKKVAQQFESMFINILMKSMRSANAVFEEGSMFNSSESGFYRDMYDQQLSVTLSQKKGIGIADTLYKQMQNRYLNPARAAITQPSQERFGQANAANPAVEQAPASGTNKFNTPEDFVNGLLPLAEKAAQRLGVDAGYLVAQSALETGWGSKIINDDSGSSFNLFNIKASRDWQGASVAKET
nr:rod-binding protein [Cellvibrionaceae bacterium]